MGEALAGPFYRAPRTRAAELVVAGSLGGFAKAAQERFREKFRAPAAFETPYYLPSRIPTNLRLLIAFRTPKRPDRFRPEPAAAALRP
jgi:hypothetical protein